MLRPALIIVIVSICKNENGDVMSDAGNYRPVFLGTIISKPFERYVILHFTICCQHCQPVWLEADAEIRVFFLNRFYHIV